MSDSKSKIEQAKKILSDIGMPSAQQNDRSALCLLAVLNIKPEDLWKSAQERLIGITPIMEFAEHHYDRKYAPNSRETFRRQTMHQFIEAGLVLYNPDDPKRAVNSPKAVYQATPNFRELVRSYGSEEWAKQLEKYLDSTITLAEKYAWEREQVKVPVRISEELTLKLSSGEHSILIKEIIESFAPRFIPGSDLVYVGDTGSKWGYFNDKLLSKLGVNVDNHGKMPDVIFHYSEQDWLVLVESVTSHGPIDNKRYDELSKLFAASTAGLVYVTALPNRKYLTKYLSDIAWETEVWNSASPSHLIHFNGDKFIGPHS